MQTKIVQPTLGALSKKIQEMTSDPQCDVHSLIELVKATALLNDSMKEIGTISVEQMAEILDIAKQRAYELAKQSDFFPALIIGKSVRINLMSLYRWMSERQVVMQSEDMAA